MIRLVSRFLILLVVFTFFAGDVESSTKFTFTGTRLCPKSFDYTIVLLEKDQRPNQDENVGEMVVRIGEQCHDVREADIQRFHLGRPSSERSQTRCQRYSHQVFQYSTIITFLYTDKNKIKFDCHTGESNMSFLSENEEEYHKPTNFQFLIFHWLSH
ncbi:unnamed protein product [Caenorhabditis brenneri]